MFEHFKMKFLMLYKKVRFLFIRHSEEDEEVLPSYSSVLQMSSITSLTQDVGFYHLKVYPSKKPLNKFNYS